MNDYFHSHRSKSMTISTVTHASDDVMMLRCSGRLVLGEDADALRERVKKLLLEGHRIVVNLTELEHIDSVGLATIAGIHRLDNSRIKIVCSSVHLTGLLRRTRLDTVIRFYETEDEAVAVVSGHGALLNPSPRGDGPVEIRH
jgi:anti-anti-sigma factor